MPNVARNIPLLGWFQLARCALFPVAIIPLYLGDHRGLSVAEVMWLQSLFGLVIALTEFPSGYLADRVGYRRTLLCGSLLVTLGWALYPFAQGFWALFGAEVVLAAGISCVSGCDSALLYESLLREGRVGSFERTFARQHASAQLAEGFAALVAGALYAMHPSVPFGAQVFVSLGMLALVYAMVEPERELRARSQSHLAHAFGTVYRALAAQPRLRAVLGLFTCIALAAYLPIWLFAPYARELGVPVGWLGPLWAAGNFAVAVGAASVPRLSGWLGNVGIAAALVVAIGVGYGGMAVGTGVLAAGFYFAICWMRGAGTALLSPHEHALIPSEARAALVSFRSMLFRLSFFVVGPLTGALVDASGFALTFAIAGALFVPLTALAILPALGRRARSRDLRTTSPAV